MCATGPAQSCSLIGLQWLGQAGHFLQHLVVGVLIVVVWLDQDDAGRPLGARRRSQILEAGGAKLMKKTVHQTDQTKTYRRKPTPQTHHFRGNVGVRQVPVLAHDGQVTVDVDGQSVSSQDHDAAHAQTETHTGRDVRRSSTQVCRVEEQARSSPNSPFLAFVEELLHLLHSSPDVLHLGS